MNAKFSKVVEPEQADARIHKVQSAKYLPFFETQAVQKSGKERRRDLEILIQNVFNSVKKNNFNYIERNKDRIKVEQLCKRNRRGNTCLYLAAAHKNLESVRYLLEYGVPVDIRNEHGNTALHKAFMNQDYDMIGLLQ